MGVVEHTFLIQSGSNRGVEWRIYDVGWQSQESATSVPYFEDVTDISRDDFDVEDDDGGLQPGTIAGIVFAVVELSHFPVILWWYGGINNHRFIHMEQDIRAASPSTFGIDNDKTKKSGIVVGERRHYKRKGCRSLVRLNQSFAFSSSSLTITTNTMSILDGYPDAIHYDLLSTAPSHKPPFEECSALVTIDGTPVADYPTSFNDAATSGQACTRRLVSPGQALRSAFGTILSPGWLTFLTLPRNAKMLLVLMLDLNVHLWRTTSLSRGIRTRFQTTHAHTSSRPAHARGPSGNDDGYEDEANTVTRILQQ
ncbi:hypothetical protein BDZ89DRAFT_1044161 [Hymenopellis radicata]|nr:hypothetical protein BDZ89DRAFT_1044161 [Hymenopellis radicata]